MDMSTPENFRSVISDFAKDLSTTFPEYAFLWSKWSDSETEKEEYERLFQYTMVLYPERFFDILYQNADIFKPDSEINTQFLPNVDFKLLYHCEGISDSTRASLWKYLQVILFTVVGSVKDKANFGDSMNLFEGIDESELQTKLKDAMGSISDFFGKMEIPSETNEKSEPVEAEDVEEHVDEEDSKPFNPKNFFGSGGMPNPESLHEHLKNLFDGKIGKLAKELAEEISEDFAKTFGEDMDNMKSTQDVFSKLMKNPEKISGLVKTVSDKLKTKMANGEISKDDLMSEAGELMKKMKEMGGAENFASMFKNMAKGMGVNIPKGAKIDTNALKSMEKKMTANDKMKARILAKKQKKAEEEALKQLLMQKQLEERRKALAASFTLSNTETPDNLVFAIKGQEKQQKSGLRPPTINSSMDLDSLVDNIENTNKPVLSASQKKNAKKKAKKLVEKGNVSEAEIDTLTSSV
jgi:ribosomal protein S17E